MKKILFSILCYIGISSLIVFVIGTFFSSIPDLILSDVLSYKVNNGLIFILTVLPSSVMTSFLLGCAISLQRLNKEESVRFSSSITKTFKTVFLLSLLFTLFLALSHDVFLPLLKSKKTEIEEKPILIKSYLNLSQDYLSKSVKNPEYANLSFFYAKKVLELDSKNEEAKSLQTRAELRSSVKEENKKNNQFVPAKKLTNSSAVDITQTPIDVTEIFKLKGASVYDLVLESERLFESGDYLGAHYYAQYAIKLADGKDANLSRAHKCANNAWAILSQSRAESLTDENLFFREKMNGYTKLINGDYLSSYYIFQRLSNSSFEYSKDSDVKRYLNIARYELSQDYFFIDETVDKDSFESEDNVYFSLKYPNGAYDIFFVKGITDINETGNLVRYLREFYIYSFDSYGDFVQSMSVPYAKMLAIDEKSLDDDQKKNYGIDSKWKTIPYIILCSIDRDVEHQKILPNYRTKDGEVVVGPNQIILPMPFDDFGVLSKYSSITSKMNYWSMNHLKSRASSYGHSDEVIMQTVLSSAFYPFVMLILLLFFSTIGWNYRLRDSHVFKFVWIFLYPCLHLVLFGVIAFAEFFIKLMNFIFMGIAGMNFALYLGFGFYIISLILVCFLFLSRKGD